MKSTIIITPDYNIKDFQVLDMGEVSTKVYDSHVDIFEFRNLGSGKIRKDSLINVSLYEDRIILDDGIEYNILRMISK